MTGEDACDVGAGNGTLALGKRWRGMRKQRGAPQDRCRAFVSRALVDFDSIYGRTTRTQAAEEEEACKTAKGLEGERCVCVCGGGECGTHALQAHALLL